MLARLSPHPVPVVQHEAGRAPASQTSLGGGQPETQAVASGPWSSINRTPGWCRGGPAVAWAETWIHGYSHYKCSRFWAHNHCQESTFLCPSPRIYVLKRCWVLWNTLSAFTVFWLLPNPNTPNTFPDSLIKSNSHWIQLVFFSNVFICIANIYLGFCIRGMSL